MADGTGKPIDEVRVGDDVANAEPDSDKTQRHTVTALHVTDGDRDFVDVSVGTPAGPKSITSTAHHLFWDTTTHAWTNATDLEFGDQLNTPGDGHAPVLTLRRYTATIRTYNLTVDAVHTYYVQAGTTPVLVHNVNGCAPGSRPDKPFTPAGKNEVWGENAAANEGVNICEICGAEVVKPLKSQRGVTPPANEGQVDHITPKSRGGSGDPSNGQLLCRVCNREKWDN
ncbi:MAG TPA: polymorphic toxin-type HINT domain-containing protein [Glaciihabitans sp.]|jgi:hypothetical protein|nr:polymorphic toxin-type HINT domain-containing protein [Glaciihabitans sp.]